MAKLTLKEINRIAHTVSFAMGHKNRDTNSEDFPSQLAYLLMEALYHMEVNAHFSDITALQNDFIFTATGGASIPHDDERVATRELSDAFWQLAGENNKPPHLRLVQERAAANSSAITNS